MLIEWLGHACFKITEKGYSVVIDPYKPKMVPGLLEFGATADMVLCSHGHPDHHYTEGVTINKDKKENPFRIETLSSYHDKQKGKKRGPNIMHVLQSDSYKIAHLGDQGIIPTKRQLERLEGLDVMMIPVGGHYTIEPEEAKTICDRVHPKLIFPMHFRTQHMGFEVLRHIKSFTDLFPGHLIKTLETNEIELYEPSEKGEVIVFSL